MNRELQATPVPTVQRLSRPLSLVPPVSDEAPFDTTELARGVDDEEGLSPYTVPEPPEMEPVRLAGESSSAETLQMEAVVPEAAASEPAEILSEADEVEIEIPLTEEPAAVPAFLAAEAVADGRVDLLEQRLHAAEDRAEREREASERLVQTLAELQERSDVSTERLSGLAERLAGIEKGVEGLHETVGALLQRLAPMENEASRHPEMERSLRVLEAGLRDLDERLRSETTHQRKDADDVAMALRGLNDRSQTLDRQITSLMHQVSGHQETLTLLSGLGDRVPPMESQLAALRELSARLPELEAQAQTILRQHHELESTLEEKTQQGRREAEDIRSQLAPLLEDRVRRHESDALLFSEMERLRESLAESLHDLAERLRHAVRGN